MTRTVYNVMHTLTFTLEFIPCENIDPVSDILLTIQRSVFQIDSLKFLQWFCVSQSHTSSAVINWWVFICRGCRVAILYWRLALPRALSTMTPTAQAAVTLQKSQVCSASTKASRSKIASTRRRIWSCGPQSSVLATKVVPRCHQVFTVQAVRKAWEEWKFLPTAKDNFTIVNIQHIIWKEYSKKLKTKLLFSHFLLDEYVSNLALHLWRMQKQVCLAGE